FCTSRCPMLRLGWKVKSLDGWIGSARNRAQHEVRPPFSGFAVARKPARPLIAWGRFVLRRQSTCLEARMIDMTKHNPPTDTTGLSVADEQVATPVIVTADKSELRPKHATPDF